MRGPGQNPGNMRRYGTLPHGGGRGPAPSGLAALGGPRPPVRRPLRGRRTSAVCSRVFAPSGPLALAPVTVGGPSRWPPSPSGAPARCPPGLRLPPPVGRGAGARAGPRPGPLPRPVGAALARRSAAGVPPARLAAAPGGAGSGGLARAAWACPAGRFGLPVRSPSALSGLAPACGPAPASVGPPLPGPPPAGGGFGPRSSAPGALVGAAPPGPLCLALAAPGAFGAPAPLRGCCGAFSSPPWGRGPM